MPNLRTALRQLASTELKAAPVAARPERKEASVRAPVKPDVQPPAKPTAPAYDCMKCGDSVRLELRGGLYSYTCSCGNRGKVAPKDYDKLRAFDALSRQEAL